MFKTNVLSAYMVIHITAKNEDKLSTSQLIMVQHEKIVDPFFLYQKDWIKQKNISCYCLFKHDIITGIKYELNTMKPY
jgi:hypothetical protein